MKNIYIIPQVLVSTMESDSCILAASPIPSTTVNAESDGENITVSDKEQKGGPTDIDYAKKNDAWTMWDE